MNGRLVGPRLSEAWSRSSVAVKALRLLRPISEGGVLKALYFSFGLSNSSEGHIVRSG